jgi:hypothetical protein
MSVQEVDFRFFPSKIKCIENPLGHKKVLDTIFLYCIAKNRTDPLAKVTGSKCTTGLILFLVTYAYHH